MIVQQQRAKQRPLDTELTQGALRIPAANESVPVLSPAPPIPTLRPAVPEPEVHEGLIHGLWARAAIGLSFWVAFGVLIWASLR
jgi:hypothetical protein